MLTKREKGWPYIEQTKQRLQDKNCHKSLKKRHNVMTKGSIHQEYKTTINIYAPNIRAPKYIKQSLTEDFKNPTFNNG